MAGQESQKSCLSCESIVESGGQADESKGVESMKKQSRQKPLASYMRKTREIFAWGDRERSMASRRFSQRLEHPLPQAAPVPALLEHPPGPPAAL